MGTKRNLVSDRMTISHDCRTAQNKRTLVIQNDIKLSTAHGRHFLPNWSSFVLFPSAIEMNRSLVCAEFHPPLAPTILSLFWLPFLSHQSLAPHFLTAFILSVSPSSSSQKISGFLLSSLRQKILSKWESHGNESNQPLSFLLFQMTGSLVVLTKAMWFFFFLGWLIFRVVRV